MDKSTSGNRIWLLTHARTGSHLLERLLSTQPRTVYGRQTFIDARAPRRRLLAAGSLEKTSQNDREALLHLLSEGYAEILAVLLRAEQEAKHAFIYVQPHCIMSPIESFKFLDGASQPRDGKRWVVGEPDGHMEIHTNPTVFPDRIFLHPQNKPIINIRHPMLIADGVYRARLALDGNRDLAGLRTAITLRWQRLVYDWFENHGTAVGVQPIILDADDYMGPDKEVIMAELCRRVGLDQDSLLFKWAPATEEEISCHPEDVQKINGTILSSDGVMPGFDTGDRTIEEQVTKWTQLYGEEEANKLETLVKAAMPDYNYMYARRLQARG